MGRAVLVVALLASCVRAELLECPSGLLCPSGLVCDVRHDRCVTPDALAACDGMPDLAACDMGVCREGVCVATGCGNGLVDPGEACDDGNTASGDGCSADCGSTETCGNGVVDFIVREQCDDGNLTQHDGCDSGCQPEVPRWTLLDQVGHPELQQAAFAYDAGRQRLVVFGGSDGMGVRHDETYEWDGVAEVWIIAKPVLAPTPRLGAAMAYDAKRHLAVMFGGSDFGGSVADTWTWDGVHWTSVTSGVAPAARQYSAMAYDTKRHRVILFGGRTSAGAVADTWAWDGAWTELHPVHTPTVRERTTIVYDPLRDQILLAGGFFGQSLTDAWVFENDDWHQVAPVGNTRLSPALVWDPVRGGVVLVGGSSNAPSALWDGAAWTTLPAIPPSRFYPVAYYDERLGAVVAGLGFPNATPLVRDMQRLDATGWTALVAHPAAFPRTASMMSYDERRGTVVLFGGNFGGDRNDTLELAGGGWVTRSAGQSGLVSRDRGAMAYDRATGTTVMWGGTFDPLVWTWDGQSGVWSSRLPVGPAPADRQTFGMAFEPGGEMILFGGLDFGNTRFADTWAWNGTAWTDLTGVGGAPPIARSSHAMALDEARGEIVLFGGSDGTLRFGDTWVWSRTGGWIEKHPPTSPQGRSRHGMAYDPIRRQVVLFGGVIGATTLDDSWAWDGITWTRVFAEIRPPAQQEPTLAFDPIGGAMIVMGTAGTWRLQWRGPTADDACATGTDRDGDGRAGCSDADCSAVCRPSCPIATSCALGPACGDGTCDAIETCGVCPTDCSLCPQRCGDLVCGSGETCPGDCPP